MKNLKSIGAVMMVSLSFTACQKDDVLAPRPSATSQTARLINVSSIPLEYPVVIKDQASGSVKFFTYNDAHQLVSINEGVFLTMFKYDKAGRVNQIIKSNQRGIVADEKFMDLQYEGDSPKPFKITEHDTKPLPDFAALKTTWIKYDARGNKISEVEMIGDRSPLTTRMFDYDMIGNCTRIREVVGRAVIKNKTFSDFDKQQSYDANVPALALIPGAIIQKNNAAHVVEMISNGMAVEHRYKFNYDDLGYANEIFERVAGVDMLVLTISFDDDRATNKAAVHSKPSAE